MITILGLNENPGEDEEDGRGGVIGSADALSSVELALTASLPFNALVVTRL